MSPAPIRLLIADDHPIFRDGLRKLLESEPGFQVVAEASNGGEAVRLVRLHSPDVLLLDVAMPGGGLQALQELGDPPTGVRTILLTAAIETDQIAQALLCGARGVVLKESATELLFKSIRVVMSEQYWVGREALTDIVGFLQQASRPAAGERTFGLTPRERQIVEAIVAGQSNRDIAGALTISEQTVKHHLSSIYDKTGVSGRLELALFAMEKGLLSRN